MKKITLLLFIFFVKTNSIFSEYSKVNKEDIIPNNNLVINDYTTNDNLIYSILEYIRDSILGLLSLITITIFIWIGVRIIAARGNPEEFKKALMSLVYAVIGLIIIAASWALVRLVSSLDF